MPSESCGPDGPERMKANHLSAWFISAGALFLIPRILWIANSESRLTDADALIALQPLIRLPLDRISEGHLSERLPIPDTRQWTRIRTVWGEPDIVISVVDATGRNLICLPSIPLRIDLTNRSGSSLTLRRGSSPYGYSEACSESSLRFQTTPGDTLKISVATSGQQSLPPGDLIVVRDWWNTKDKLVGVYLNDDIDSFTRWTSVVGILFLVAGAILILIGQARKRLTA